MSAPPYQKLFWGSYHKHTAHLSHAREHGAYLLLIGALWNNDGRLPADDDVLAAYARLTTKEWLTIKPKLMPLFKVVRGKLTQARVVEDLAKYKDTSGKRKQAGKAGGLASIGKRTENREANASVLPTKPEPEPEPEPIEDQEPTVPCPAKPNVAGFPEDFAKAWKAYPAKGRERSKSQAKTLPIWREAAKAAGGGDRLAAAVARYVREDQTHKGECGPPAFDRWLRDGRWEHWLPDARAPSSTGLNPDLLAIHERLTGARGHA